MSQVTEGEGGGMKEMAKWLSPVQITAAYIVLMRWVLPRLGYEQWRICPDVQQECCTAQIAVKPISRTCCQLGTRANNNDKTERNRT
jgi:hypothetical protein